MFITCCCCPSTTTISHTLKHQNTSYTPTDPSQEKTKGREERPKTIAMKWLGTLRSKFTKSHHPTVVLLRNNSSNEDESTVREEEEDDDGDEKKKTLVEDIVDSDEASCPLEEKRLSEDDPAAIKIQAFFRGHLARQAFRALKSLVKLQALVRGFCTRRQARIALYCMQTLVRLEVQVRARQLLSRSEEAQVPHHSHSTLKP